MEKTHSTITSGYLNRLGVFGFDAIEPIILASLISEDPILLIGKAGTGKTFLLNSISEAMQLEHRHYNASQISFDDLIGFPYPESDGRSIRFLPTPATIWEAESVLVDELNRCKPETQNKFFSIIHERRIHGMSVSRLAYRWAAMNPFVFSNGQNDEHYEGCEPLDPALADRFAFVIEVPDWIDLSENDQWSVIHPAGEAAISYDGGSLRELICTLKPIFQESIQHPLTEVLRYVRLVATLTGNSGFRISPRRARLLTRNLTALLTVARGLNLDLSPKGRGNLYKLAFTWSIPHRAYAEHIPPHLIDSVHAEAIRLSRTDQASEAWATKFQAEQSLINKACMLFEEEVDKDIRSIAVMQLLAAETPERSALFAFAVGPALLERHLIHEDVMQEVMTPFHQIIELQGEINWNEPLGLSDTEHPAWVACQDAMDELSYEDEHRRNRANQLFLYLITRGHEVIDPVGVEHELNECFLALKKLPQISSEA
jgi:MoxR-like ATPase